MTHVHEGEWCARCVEHGVAECVKYGYFDPDPLRPPETDEVTPEAWEYVRRAQSDASSKWRRLPWWLRVWR